MHSRTTTVVQFSLGLLILFALLPANAQAGARTNRGHDDTSVSGSSAQATDAPSNTAHDGTYIIGTDDVLAINVWNEKDISRSVPVRSDGRISLPLVGEIQAAGQTPLQLEREITSTLRNFITAPSVAVMVEKINSKKFNILGEVVRPGSYSIALAGTVVDAIALAGGFKDFAKKNDIYVLRSAADGSQVRIHFKYKQFIAGKNAIQNVNLEPHDTIIVP
jgi:polysaccharide biosynthesis/export protein